MSGMEGDQYTWFDLPDDEAASILADEYGLDKDDIDTTLTFRDLYQDTAQSTAERMPRTGQTEPFETRRKVAIRRTALSYDDGWELFPDVEEYCLREGLFPPDTNTDTYETALEYLTNEQDLPVEDADAIAQAWTVRQYAPDRHTRAASKKARSLFRQADLDRDAFYSMWDDLERQFEISADSTAKDNSSDDDQHAHQTDGRTCCGTTTAPDEASASTESSSRRLTRRSFVYGSGALATSPLLGEGALKGLNAL